MDLILSLSIITAGILLSSILVYFWLYLKNQKKISLLQNEYLEKERILNQQKTEAEKLGLIWEERFGSLKTESDA